MLPWTTVNYRLTPENADAINAHRQSAGTIDAKGYAAAGDVVPLTVLKTWPDTEPQEFYGQVMLDGNYLIWVERTRMGEGPGTCAAP